MITDLLVTNEERKAKMGTIERIARFHLEFEGIHPFIDGNGRTGRLIHNLDLIRNGYPPINVKFTDRKKYYDSFDEYYRNDNADKMTELVAGYDNERLDEYLRILNAEYVRFIGQTLLYDKKEKIYFLSILQGEMI